MEGLPSSIEAYLIEAGFSGTELVVIKKLLEDNALTLRELASKTGKSTGVLDQAIKKLMKKGIVRRESINSTPKYVMDSLTNVVAWMQEDMSMKQTMLQRKHENFESFVRSLTIKHKKRPDMEYFEGIDGMKKAYTQIIERGNDIVQYGPTIFLAEEDPLRDFRVQFFRERRGRGVFSRVITHDDPLGRRSQSRDPFEYRRTILVDPELYPFSFEKIIVGDTVACFDLREYRACFIRYPELAEDERVFFERLWNKKIATQKVDVPEHELNQPPQKPVVNISLKTRTLSQVREFFLSRKSISTFATFAALAGVITYGLYLHNVNLNTQRIQERVKSIAATGALQFSPEELDQLHTIADINKPEYAKVIYQLNQIRNQNIGIRYVYLMRPTQDVSLWEFIADADSINPFLNEDVNNDGKLDEIDEKNFPGQSYDVAETYLECQEGLIHPVAFGPFVDQWGTLISGWAPVKNSSGTSIGILGVDIDADSITKLTEKAFIPLYYFLGFFLLFIVIRLAAFNRSLFQELCELGKKKKVALLFGAGLAVAIVASLFAYVYDTGIRADRARERIMAIATTGAVQFAAEDIDQLRTLGDTATPAYQRVVRQLHDIRERNESIKYAYILRPRRDSTTFEFVADADAYGLDLSQQTDTNGDGVIDGADDVGYPGLAYDIAYIDALDAATYAEPFVTDKPYTDKWGTVLTGYAPIRNSSGTVSGLLAIDVDATDALQARFVSLWPLGLYLIIVLVYLLLHNIGHEDSLLRSGWTWLARKKILYIAAFILMAVYWIVFAWRWYERQAAIEETGKRLMAIAATAALQINPDDLESLRKAGDMQREEYQRVFRQLNEVRDQNPEITYIYILRPTEVEGIWEFVVDADSNVFLPDFFEVDGDNKLTEADESTFPGMRYDAFYSMPVISKLGLQKPVIEIATDQWGTFLTGSAPMFNNERKAVAVLGIDVRITDL